MYNYLPFIIFATDKDMKTISILSSEFRENQAHYLDLIDNGKKVIINRKKDRSYLIIGLENDDFELRCTPKLKKRLKTELESIRKNIVK